MEARTLAKVMLETCAKKMSGEPAEVVITMYDEETGAKMTGRDIRFVLANTEDNELDIMCWAEETRE